MRLDIAAVFVAALARADAATKQCYFAAGKQALDAYVPCSDSGGDSSCCLAGDYCLVDGACYSPNTQMTYIAGCTDPTYSDGSCKGGQDTCQKQTQFQGIAVCGNNWVCCGDRGQTGVTPSSDYSDTCPCDKGYQVAIFNAGTSLAALTQLGTNVPTIRESPSTAAPTSSGTTTRSSSSSQTTSSDTSDTSDSSSTSAAPSSTIPLPSGATGGIHGTGAGSEPAAQSETSSPAPDNTRLKVGLGVGIPVAAAVIGAVGVAAFCLRRRLLGGSPRYVTQADLSTPVWQGEVASSGLPETESGAYNSSGGWKQNGEGSTAYAPMREQPTPPPQYKFGGDEGSLHRPESQGILQANRNA